MFKSIINKFYQDNKYSTILVEYLIQKGFTKRNANIYIKPNGYMVNIEKDSLLYYTPKSSGIIYFKDKTPNDVVVNLHDKLHNLTGLLGVDHGTSPGYSVFTNTIVDTNDNIIKMKAVNYIVNKRSVCRHLMLKHKIPQYCFKQIYIMKEIPKLKYVIRDNLVFIYTLDNYPLYCINISDLYKTSNEIMDDVIYSCNNIINNKIREKQESINDLNRKINKLKHNLSTLNILNEDI